jgi:hypothetical protein
MSDLIKTEEKAKWADLNKKINISGNNAVD